MGDPVSEIRVRVRRELAARLAALLAWDAPFLPEVVGVEGEADGVRLACRARGTPLAAVADWPRGARAATLLQLVACATFLVERGFLPLRGVLRRARVERTSGGVHLRLATPPLLRAEEVHTSARLRTVVRAEEGLLGRVLMPLAKTLLPERFSRLAAALERCAPWEVGPVLVAELLADKGASTLLSHPAGKGRALWARQFQIPEAGTYWVEGEELLEPLAAAARLAAAASGRGLRLRTGLVDEEEAAREEAAAAMANEDSTVLTTIPLEGARCLALAEGEWLWLLAPQPARAHEHLQAALELGREQPAVVRGALEAGAATAFSEPPRAPSPKGVTLASSSARRSLLWLQAAPAGLTGEELAALGGGQERTLAELVRLGLAYRREGVWYAVSPAVAGDGQRLMEMAHQLPPESPRRLLARALALDEWTALARWCQERLDEGHAREVHTLLRAAPVAARLPQLAAEAALQLGRLAEAEAWLESVPPGERDTTWHLLRAWWAVASNVPEGAREAVDEVQVEGLARRLAARAAWVRAQLAFLRGNREEERRYFQEAARLAPRSVPDAVAEVAVGAGHGALRRARAALVGVWSGDTVATVLYTLAARAWFAGHYSAAGTALRAALRLATGHNPKLLGEIHADLGAAALQAERPEAAERHLLLAEQWLERAGSRRATTVVRFNRAVIANDLLDWRRSRQLVVSARTMRGGGEGVSSILEDLELVRCDLVRGEVEAVAAALARIEGAARAVSERAGLVEAVAALRGYLALARGDVEGAETCAAGADEGDRELLLAVVQAARGVVPARELPRRWGVAVTARLLAHWVRGEEEVARQELARSLATSPREAAVGFARFVACLGRRGERLPAPWSGLRVEAERVLDGAGLDGWAGRLRRQLGPDTLEVVRALDGVLGAGSDALAVARLERLCRALELEGLRVSLPGGPTVQVGAPAGEGEELTLLGVTAVASGRLSEVARAALLLVLRQVPLLLGAGEPASRGGGSNLLGASRALARVREEIARWAPLPAPVLITGEPGTGKEVVARELHRESGRRGEFIAVNCAGIPATLLESELFGVARGAFTGADRDRGGLVEAAEGGTLFLDEVGELPVELQGKLLRLLQEREVRRVGATSARRVDVRFVAATNRDLAAAIAAGSFRQDLYYRLAYAVIAVPPLRERPEDIEALAVHFTAELARTFQRPGVRLSAAALARLRQGQWPGNVRELESCLARAVAAARPGEVLGPDRFADVVGRQRSELPPWAEALAAFRRSYFADLLAETGGNRSAAARRAGISRQTLLYHLRELGLLGRGEA
jgi:DNA-binding NtrC family response regulator/tetratricopeptide (TPR) repeat protein